VIRPRSEKYLTPSQLEKIPESVKTLSRTIEAEAKHLVVKRVAVSNTEMSPQERQDFEMRQLEEAAINAAKKQRVE